ncbi:MAG TPA: inositol monophosphatase family protein [Acidimicrobiales bacterium]|nr:inositol monophosphatase family protein [Acidimicrobiales bacterium]
MDDATLLEVLHGAVGAVVDALGGLDDWGLAGTRPDQYRSDLAADAAAVGVLIEAGVGVLSEESGLTNADRPLVAVLDPVDGSTNASRGLPWYATSICVLDEEGARAAVVANLASGRRYEAVRGGGARRDGRPITPSGRTTMAGAVVGVSGLPRSRPPWRQTRALGASALDLCLVADGTLDAFCDNGKDAHGPWDFLGAMLVCLEAGAAVADAEGRDLIVRTYGPRRIPLAAASSELLEELIRFRR